LILGDKSSVVLKLDRLIFGRVTVCDEVQGGRYDMQRERCYEEGDGITRRYSGLGNVVWAGDRYSMQS
jgi:hypothetical protein